MYRCGDWFKKKINSHVAHSDPHDYSKRFTHFRLYLKFKSQNSRIVFFVFRTQFGTTSLCMIFLCARSQVKTVKSARRIGPSAQTCH